MSEKPIKTYPGRGYLSHTVPPPKDGSHFLGWCTKGRYSLTHGTANIYMFDKKRGFFIVRDFPTNVEIYPDAWALIPSLEMKSWPGKK